MLDWNGKLVLSATEEHLRPCYFSLTLSLITCFTPTLSPVLSYSAHLLILLPHPHILQTIANFSLYSGNQVLTHKSEHTHIYTGRQTPWKLLKISFSNWLNGLLEQIVLSQMWITRAIRQFLQAYWMRALSSWVPFTSVSAFSHYAQQCHLNRKIRFLKGSTFFYKNTTQN